MESPRPSEDASIELKARKREVVCAMRVLADLHHAEESIALESKLSVNLCVDLERHCATLLLEVAELSLESVVLLLRFRVVNASV